MESEVKDKGRLQPKKILVIDLAFIGDVILATPVTRALKEAYPEAMLTMLTVPLTAEVAAMNPYVDDVLVYDKRGRHKGLFGMLAVGRELKKHSFDLAICMNFAVRGAVVAWLAGIPLRIGYDAQHASLFLTNTSPAQRSALQHETLNHLEVLRPLGITTADTSLRLEPAAAAQASLQRKLERYSLPSAGYIVLCPFGSYARKNLSLAAAAHIVRHLSQRQPVYLIGGTKEAAGLEKIARLAELPLTNVLAGTLTLSELTALLQHAACMVTVDTGPLHIAEAVGCPLAAVFGPTDPRVWGPRGRHSMLLYHKKDCSPCWGKGVCEQNECIQGITANEILQAVRLLLGEKDG